MELVTDQTRKAVWGALCDLEWNTRYYTAMAELYRRRHRWLRFTILVGVLVEAAILYAATAHAWAFYVGASGGLLLTGLTIWDVVSDYAENAAILRITAFACDDLKRETETLWRSIESDRVSTQDAENALKSIFDRWAAATQRVPSETNDRLNRQTSAAANRDLANRYAIG